MISWLLIWHIFKVGLKSSLLGFRLTILMDSNICVSICLLLGSYFIYRYYKCYYIPTFLRLYGTYKLGWLCILLPPFTLFLPFSPQLSYFPKCYNCYTDFGINYLHSWLHKYIWEFERDSVKQAHCAKMANFWFQGSFSMPINIYSEW